LVDVNHLAQRLLAQNKFRDSGHRPMAATVRLAQEKRVGLSPHDTVGNALYQ
jgi:hypothetical protein